MAEPEFTLGIVQAQIEERELRRSLYWWLCKKVVGLIGLIILLNVTAGCSRDPELMRVVSMERRVLTYSAVAVDEDGLLHVVEGIRPSDSVDAGDLIFVEKERWLSFTNTLHRP